MYQEKCNQIIVVFRSHVGWAFQLVGWYFTTFIFAVCYHERTHDSLYYSQDKTRQAKKRI
jgi:hypothetical protein